MLFSGGACSRRVSLFKAVLFSAKMRKAQEREERERVGSWERAGEFCLRLRQCFVLCVECRGREERGKKDSSFLEMKKKRVS